MVHDVFTSYICMPLTPVFHRDRCWCIFPLAHNFFLSLMLCLNPYFSLEIQTQVVHTKGTSTSGLFRFLYPTWETLTNLQYLHLFWKSLLLWGHKGLAVQAQPKKFPCSIGFPVTALYPHILSKSGFSCMQHEHSGHEPSQDPHLKTWQWELLEQVPKTWERLTLLHLDFQLLKAQAHLSSLSGSAVFVQGGQVGLGTLGKP